MPALLLVLAFVKKYWKYILLVVVVLSIFTYCSIIIHEAKEYKTVSKEVKTQQKTIVDYSDALIKQKDYTVKVETNYNNLEKSNNDIVSTSKTETTKFNTTIKENPTKINDDFNDLFGRFNNE